MTKANGYKAFYKGKTTEVFSDTQYHAQQKAAEFFKTKKAFEVTVVLCQIDNEDGTFSQVTNSTASF